MSRTFAHTMVEIFDLGTPLGTPRAKERGLEARLHDTSNPLKSGGEGGI